MTKQQALEYMAKNMKLNPSAAMALGWEMYIIYPDQDSTRFVWCLRPIGSENKAHTSSYHRTRREALDALYERIRDKEV